jgi:hypothetical protein
MIVAYTHALRFVIAQRNVRDISPALVPKWELAETRILSCFKVIITTLDLVGTSLLGSLHIMSVLLI